MLYFITGVNGVGKTKFIKELIENKKDFCHISGSFELMNQLGIKNGDYEKLRNFDEKVKKDIFNTIISNASKKYFNNHSEHAVIDGHILNIKNGKIVKVINNNTIKLFSAVIYLTAKTSEIIERIDKDKYERNRAIFSKEKDVKDKEEILDLYIRKFEKKLKDIYTTSGVNLYEVSHFENKTNESVILFNKIHQKTIR